MGVYTASRDADKHWRRRFPQEFQFHTKCRVTLRERALGVKSWTPLSAFVYAQLVFTLSLHVLKASGEIEKNGKLLKIQL